MKITVTVECRNAEEAKEVCNLLSQEVKRGSDKDLGTDKGTGSKGVEAYTPGSERERLAQEALGRCKRVSVLRPAIISSWALAYPHVDIAAEIAKCEAWAQGKEVTRTPRGWQRALTSWLSRVQDSSKGSVMPVATGAAPARAIVVNPAVDEWAQAAQ